MTNKMDFVKDVMGVVQSIIDGDFGLNPDWDIKEQCACVTCDAKDASERIVFMMDIENGHYWISPVYNCHLFDELCSFIGEELGFEEDGEWLTPMDFSDDEESGFEGLEDFMDTVPGAKYFWSKLN